MQMRPTTKTSTTPPFGFVASLARGPLSGQRGKICGVVECRVWKSDLFLCLGDEGEGATADATGILEFRRIFWRSYCDWLDKDALDWFDWDAFDWADLTRYFPSVIFWVLDRFLRGSYRIVGNALMERSRVENQRRARKQIDLWKICRKKRKGKERREEWEKGRKNLTIEFILCI